MNAVLKTILLCAVMGMAACAAQKPSGEPASNPLGEPKRSIAHQFELLKAGDVEKLRACFTDRQRERITAELVARGKEDASNYTLDDLVASVETGEDEGKQTAKIKMKNGRTLTTLILTDGKWLADTVWFK